MSLESKSQNFKEDQRSQSSQDNFENEKGRRICSAGRLTILQQSKQLALAKEETNDKDIGQKYICVYLES